MTLGTMATHAGIRVVIDGSGHNPEWTVESARVSCEAALIKLPSETRELVIRGLLAALNAQSPASSQHGDVPNLQFSNDR